MKSTVIATSLLASLLASAAFAADVGPYLGGGIGYADVVTDDDEDDLQDALTAQGFTSTIDNDSSNFNFRVFAGYQVTPNFGAEVAYLTLGDADVEAAITAPVTARVEAESDVDGFEFVATGAYPISDTLDLTARIGGIYWNADGKVEVTGTGANAVNRNFDIEDDGVAFTGGVGFARKFGTNWIWRGGWQYVDTDKVEHLFLSGIAYRFDM